MFILPQEARKTPKKEESPQFLFSGLVSSGDKQPSLLPVVLRTEQLNLKPSEIQVVEKVEDKD